MLGNPTNTPFQLNQTQFLDLANLSPLPLSCSDADAIAVAGTPLKMSVNFRQALLSFRILLICFFLRL